MESNNKRKKKKESLKWLDYTVTKEKRKQNRKISNRKSINANRMAEKRKLERTEEANIRKINNAKKWQKSE